MRYFELFSIPVSFDVDLATVNQRYLDIQRAVHPDRHSHASERERLLAVQKTAEINDALETLKHPLKRAEYMLAERGVDIRGEQQTLQDPLFLMQQMELREELEEIADAANPESAIDAFEGHIRALDKQYSDQLGELLNSEDKAQLEQAADQVRKLKFIYKLREELARIEDTLFDD